MSDSGALPNATSMEGVLSALIYLLSCYAHDPSQDGRYRKAIEDHLRILRDLTITNNLPMLASTVNKLLKYHWIEQSSSNDTNSQLREVTIH